MSTHLKSIGDLVAERQPILGACWWWWWDAGPPAPEELTLEFMGLWREK